LVDVSKAMSSGIKRERAEEEYPPEMIEAIKIEKSPRSVESIHIDDEQESCSQRVISRTWSSPAMALDKAFIAKEEHNNWAEKEVSTK